MLEKYTGLKRLEVEDYSPIDDFLAHAEVYNATALSQYISSMVRRSANLTGGEIAVSVSGIDTTKSIKEVLKWCVENPQSAEKLSKAVDLMIPGWERAKFMELLESTSNPA